MKDISKIVADVESTLAPYLKKLKKLHILTKKKY